MRRRGALFRWPVLDRFNWALDHFDGLPGDQAALWIIGEGGGEDGEERLTFAQMRARSNQVANWLRGQGVRRGDRVLLLLGNVRPLWEATLACMKLGAVVIPATTMLAGPDLRDRFERGQVRHVVADGALAPRFEGMGAGWTRIAVGGAPGWARFEDAYGASDAFEPDGETRATDPLLLYFTSGTTSKPKLVLHSHQSYPAGHLSTMYLAGLPARRRSPQHLVAGLGEARLEQLVRAVERGGDGARAEPRQVRREGGAGRAAAVRGGDVLRAADGVADVGAGGFGGGEGRAARGAGRGGAAEPGGDRGRAPGLGCYDPGRLRADGDHAADRQRAGDAARARQHGAADAGLRGGAARPGGERGRGGRDRAAAGRGAAARAHGGLRGRRRRGAAGRGRVVSHGRRREPRTRTAPLPTSAARTTCSSRAATASARSSWRAR